MYSLSQAFHHARRWRNQRPVVVFTLVNAFGARVYGERFPGEETAGLVRPPLADGSWLADGARTAGAGSLNLLDRDARVLSFGRVRETLVPGHGELLASLRQEEAGSVSVTLSNAGAKGERPFSRIEGTENLLGAKGEILVGYPGLPARDYLTRFSGRVVAYRLEADRITLSLRST